MFERSWENIRYIYTACCEGKAHVIEGRSDVIFITALIKTKMDKREAAKSNNCVSCILITTLFSLSFFLSHTPCSPIKKSLQGFYIIIGLFIGKWLGCGPFWHIKGSDIGATFIYLVIYFLVGWMTALVTQQKKHLSANKPSEVFRESSYTQFPEFI